jgi:hypothetical protein
MKTGGKKNYSFHFLALPMCMLISDVISVASLTNQPFLFLLLGVVSFVDYGKFNFSVRLYIPVRV